MATKKKTTGKRTTKKRSTKSRSKARLASQGSEIMDIAKRIRKKNPGKKWTTCVKEAGKEYKRKR